VGVRVRLAPGSRGRGRVALLVAVIGAKLASAVEVAESQDGEGLLAVGAVDVEEPVAAVHANVGVVPAARHASRMTTRERRAQRLSSTIVGRTDEGVADPAGDLVAAGCSPATPSSDGAAPGG